MTIEDLPDPEEPLGFDGSQLDGIRREVQEMGETHFIIARSPLDGTFPWEETKLRNHAAMRQAIRDYGRYPISQERNMR